MCCWPGAIDSCSLSSGRRSRPPLFGPWLVSFRPYLPGSAVSPVPAPVVTQEFLALSPAGCAFAGRRAGCLGFSPLPHLRCGAESGPLGGALRIPVPGLCLTATSRAPPWSFGANVPFWPWFLCFLVPAPRELFSLVAGPSISPVCNFDGALVASDPPVARPMPPCAPCPQGGLRWLCPWGTLWWPAGRGSGSPGAGRGSRLCPLGRATPVSSCPVAPFSFCRHIVIGGHRFWRRC